MIQVELSDTGPVVDVSLIANAFDLDPVEIQNLMRAGKITSRCERGVGKDAGRWRLTFWHADRALRMTVDDTGTILSRVRIPILRERREGNTKPAACHD